MARINTKTETELISGGGFTVDRRIIRSLLPGLGNHGGTFYSEFNLRPQTSVCKYAASHADLQLCGATLTQWPIMKMSPTATVVLKCERLE